MFCTDFAHPTWFIFNANSPVLLYYTHLPAIFLSLFVSLFIFFKNRKSIPARVLLLISVMFSVYLYFDLMTWSLTNTALKMFVWSLMIPLAPAMYLATAYFVYSFMESKDVPFRWKVVSLALLSPTIILLPTVLTLTGFDFFLCEATQDWSIPFGFWGYGLEVLASAWIFYYLIRKLFSKSAEIRSKATFLLLGTLIFLVSLFGTDLYGALTGGNGWQATEYGFLGVLAFIAVLVYLIVRYSAFSIKLLGAQVLVWALGFGVFAMLFISDLRVIEIVTAITLGFVLVVGFLLVRSVKKQETQSRQLKGLADSLQDLTAHLQERVDEQTHEVKKAYLVEKQARENLEKLDKLKDEFILTTQHQMRTPLSGTKWALKMLIDGEFGPLAEEQKAYLIKASESNDRLIHVVNDMLGAIKINSVENEKNVPINLLDLFDKVMFDLASQVKKKNVSIKMNKPEQSLPVINNQEEKIRLVFQNILENAVRYSNGGGEIEVSFKPQDADVLVSVTDHGIGIPKEFQKYVFERFFRATNAVKAETDGTGLGLYVTKSILEKIGGKIWFESKEGKGTSFYFTIPLSNKI